MYNIVLEDRDSLNKNANTNEVNARRILEDLMYDLNLKDCFRELVPNGGFTWQRNRDKINEINYPTIAGGFLNNMERL